MSGGLFVANSRILGLYYEDNSKIKMQKSKLQFKIKK